MTNFQQVGILILFGEKLSQKHSNMQSVIYLLLYKIVEKTQLIDYLLVGLNWMSKNINSLISL